MYLGIDVGATKTLLTAFSPSGELLHQLKFATAGSYQKFLRDLKSHLQQKPFDGIDLKACCCALPGEIDREKGIGVRFGNLSWRNVAIVSDLQKILSNVSVFVENDANLAGLYEALTAGEDYDKVLYLTISTGIGDGIITEGKIDPEFADSEPGQMVLEHDGKLQKWEAFASGRAFTQKYGKKVAEVDNPFIWKRYAKALAPGIGSIVATIQPDVIIIGGGVGAHLEKFLEYLESELKKYTNEMVPIPPIIKADKAEEAVAYGCYEFIKQNL